MENIGKFKIKSGKIIITDPCYEKGIWCQERAENVKKGTWSAYIKKTNDQLFGERISELIAVHDDFDIEEMNFEKHSNNIGVDSGQAGIFDEKYYKDDSIVKDNMLSHIRSDEKWYSMCCKQSLSEEQAGVVLFGCVSSSGYGDGNYSHYVCFVNDEIVAVKIIFIGDEEENEGDE